MIKKLCCAVLAVAVYSVPGYGWDVSGHMIVAQIAYERLNPNARAHVDQLSQQLQLKNAALNAVNIAAWADEIKHQHGGPYAGDFKNWHFIDLGCNAGDPDLIANPPRMTIQNGDLVTALNRCLAVIKQHVHDPLITNDVIALALIMHLVGVCLDNCASDVLYQLRVSELCVAGVWKYLACFDGNQLRYLFGIHDP